MPKNSKHSKQKGASQRSAKEERLFQNLLKITEQFMGGKSFLPLTQEELMQRLSLPPQHEAIFKDILRSLIDQQLIEETNQRYSWRQSKSEIITGIMRMHPRGFGFVQTNHPSYTQDVFIPKHLTKNSVDGDEVEILINQENVSEKGPEGKVIAILSRARTHMAGIIRKIDNEGQFVAYVPLLGSQQKVIVQPSEEKALQVGDRIVMEVVDWGSSESETVCRMSHYLGHISDASCDISAAIEEFELRADFPSKVVEEALSLGTRVSAKDLKDREDLRHLTTFTIDPDTAKDYDDALSLTLDAEGIYHLGVHIADVSHYVKPGTALDEEAQQRCNSTYFPSYCLSMLPSALSDNLCSLKPNVNRLTASIFMRFDSKGDLLSYRISRSYIKSAKRFTYKEAKQVLDGKKESPHADALHLMVKLCRLLKQKRYERGSIEFSLPELVILVDEKGMPYTTDYVTYDITHQMVEEFMLKANEMIAWDLTQKGKYLTYRVHDEPAEENLRDFSALAAAFGFRVPDKPTARDLQKLFEEAGETSYANFLASSYIRRMRLAIYSAENIGHYGLSLSHYCHFTSPIRRYVDLVVHRILFGENNDFEYLQEIANRCSEQERISAKAENSVVLLKKLRLLQQHHQQEPYREYPAIITRVKNFGVYFEVIDFMLEGFLHISELDEDYFVYDEGLMRLRGTRRGKIYTAGDQLTVMLKEVDFVSSETKWYVVAHDRGERLIESIKPQKAKASRPASDKAKKPSKKWGAQKSGQKKQSKKKSQGSHGSKSSTPRTRKK